MGFLEAGGARDRFGHSVVQNGVRFDLRRVGGQVAVFQSLLRDVREGLDALHPLPPRQVRGLVVRVLPHVQQGELRGVVLRRAFGEVLAFGYVDVLVGEVARVWGGQRLGGFDHVTYLEIAALRRLRRDFCNGKVSSEQERLDEGTFWTQRIPLFQPGRPEHPLADPRVLRVAKVLLRARDDLPVGVPVRSAQLVVRHVDAHSELLWTAFRINHVVLDLGQSQQAFPETLKTTALNGEQRRFFCATYENHKECQQNSHIGTRLMTNVNQAQSFHI